MNASDSLTVTFDAHDSDAEGKGDQNGVVILI